MKFAFGQRELKSVMWGGLKPMAATVLLLPPINAPMRFVARNVLPTRVCQRLPLNISEVAFQPVDAAPVKMLDVHRDQVARDIYWGGGRPTSEADSRVLRLVERLSADVTTFLDIGSYAALFALLAGYKFFQSLQSGFAPRERLVPSAEGRDWIFSARPEVQSTLDLC